MAAEICVLIVEDSALARDFLRCILEEAGGFVVIAEAANGSEALALLAGGHQPDLITMDLEMPVMGGLECIELIMEKQAVPILVVSAVADAGMAYAAISKGALDVVEKPSLDNRKAEEFVNKARMVSKIKVIKHLRVAKSADLQQSPQTMNTVGARGPRDDMIFAIASSTGGPQALNFILAGLPENFPAAIVIAQHITDDGFAVGMAGWLNIASKLPVTLAQDGDSIIAGHVYLSPSERNLVVTQERRLKLSERTGTDIYHPSCDNLLGSVAQVYGRKAVGIILTGMGNDGAAGMCRIAAMGGRTLAQDSATSVIYGMNQIAIEQGCVQSVLPLEQIPDAMLLALQGTE